MSSLYHGIDRTIFIFFCYCMLPNIVLYEEDLNMKIMLDAKQAIESADALIVVGTSLIVQPASSFINWFKGTKFVIINMQNTPYDAVADLVINEPIEKVIEKLKGNKSEFEK